jgi:hypothetical protein
MNTKELNQNATTMEKGAQFGDFLPKELIRLGN